MKRTRTTRLMLAVTVLATGIATTQDVRPFTDLFLQVADVRPGMTVADVGAGRGDEETRKAIENAGYVFETLIVHDDPIRNFFYPSSYALVFRVPSES